MNSSFSVPRAAQHILVVDDTTELRDIMRVVLESDGFVVRELDSAQHIEREIASHRPDLILCDLLMPGRDGFAVFKALQDDESTRDIPLVLATAKNFPGDRHAALQAGVAAYLVKPFDADALLETVHDVLSERCGVRVWGCRGSIATPEHASGAFGGNTACVELILPPRITGGQHRVIFDAGTGIRALGNSIGHDAPLRATLFLTHFHWDHIQGLPFFKPLYKPGNEISIFGPAADSNELVATIGGQMGGAFFPITTDAFSSSVKYIGLGEETFEAAGLQFETLGVMHPGQTLAYKVTWQEHSIVYVPDNEVLPDSVANSEGQLELSGEALRLAQWIEGASLLLHDCQYDREGYEAHPGWGHSSACYLAAVAAVARVPQVLLFHHDPDHGDAKIEAIHHEFRTQLEAYDPECAQTIQSQPAAEDTFYPL